MSSDLRDWARYQFGVSAIERWKPHVPDAGHAASYRYAGFEPETAGQWYADPVARRIVAETAAALRQHGWTPTQAAQAYLAIQETDPDVRFMDPNRAAIQAIEEGDGILTTMAATGRPVPDALACHRAGLTPAEAADPALDMATVRAMAALRPGQPERPRHGW